MKKPGSKGEYLEFTVPRLLADKVIEKIRKQGKLNKTNHNPNSNKFLLTNFIFCGCGCEYKLQGQTNHGKTRFYRYQSGRDKPCSMHHWIPADEIENTVIIALVRMFGDPEELQKAVERYIPDREKIEGLTAERDQLRKDLEEDDRQMKTLARKVAKRIITDKNVKAVEDEIEGRIKARNARLAEIAPQLAYLPDRDRIKQLSKRVLRIRFGMLAHYLKQERADKVLAKDYTWKRNLVERCFDGEDLQGRPLGVYVVQEPSGRWSWTVRGILEKVLTGTLLGDKFNDDLELGFDQTMVKYASPLPGTFLLGCCSP
jgi:hypothetical protein